MLGTSLGSRIVQNINGHELAVADLHTLHLICSASSQNGTTLPKRQSATLHQPGSVSVSGVLLYVPDSLQTVIVCQR